MYAKRKNRSKYRHNNLSLKAFIILVMHLAFFGIKNYLSFPHLARVVGYCIIGLLLLPFVSWGQKENTRPREVIIDGYVLDRDRQPIELANIRITGTTKGTTANLKGYYKLSISPTTDSLILEYSCIGYQTYRKVFPKGITRSQRFNPELGESSIDIGSVTVVAPTKAIQQMEVIKAEHVKINAGPTKGVESVVGTYAGVTQNNELSSQYTVRGGSFDENLVYVNGIEIHRPLLVRTAQQEGLSFVNSDLIQSINFSAGAFGAEYGERNSSVLDIRYKTPDRHFEGAATAGLQYNSLYLGHRQGAFNSVTGLRLKSGRALLRSLETRAEYDPLYTDAQTFLQWKPGNKLSASLLGHVSYTHYRYYPTKRETTFGTLENAKKFTVYFEGGERDLFLNYTLAGQLSYRPAEAWNHTLILSHFNSQEAETYDISGAYYLQEGGTPGESGGNTLESKTLATGTNHDHARNFLHYSITGANYKGSYTLSRGGTIQWGAGARYERVRDNISEWTLLDSAGYNLPRHPERIEMKYNLYAKQFMQSVRLSAFALYKGQRAISSGTLFFNTGGRLSWWSLNRQWLPSIRGNLSFRPAHQSQSLFRLAGGLYHQAPFYKELRLVQTDESGNNIVALNRNIKAQSSIQILFGADYDFTMADRKFKATAEGYFKYLYNINPYYINNVKLRYLGDNIGTGYIAGIDLKLFGEFVPKVDSWITLSLLHARQNIKGYGSMAMPNAPLYNFSLFFQDYFPGYKKLRLSLRGVLSGGLPQINAAKGFSKPIFTGTPYKRIDIGMHYRLYDRDDKSQNWFRIRALQSIDLGVSAFNLFDMSNIDSYFWISDAYRNEYAIPNYLTGRLIDFSLSVTF